MAGPARKHLPAEKLSLLHCVMDCGGRVMGKFFLVIIAISVAILLAMSAYVISL